MVASFFGSATGAYWVARATCFGFWAALTNFLEAAADLATVFGFWAALSLAAALADGVGFFSATTF